MRQVLLLDDNPAQLTFGEVIEARQAQPGEDLISILVNGAEPLNREELLMFCMLLLIAGNETTTNLVSNGALALLRSDAGREKIGAVITDHLMPGMDGVEFVKQLRSFNEDLPVIVISGLPDADQEYQGLNVFFRPKPCEPDDLIDLVRTTLNDPRYRASA